MGKAVFFLSLITFLLSLFVQCIHPKILESRKCSKISLKEPYKSNLELDKSGRVYIPLHLSSKGDFSLSLGSGLAGTTNEESAVLIFLRIKDHKFFSGGMINVFGEEEILEKYTDSNLWTSKVEEVSKGYFLRVRVRTKYTSVALYPAGNEANDPYLLFRVETTTSSTKINSFVMTAKPASTMFVDCKSKLHQRCTFSTDCLESGSICRSLEGETSPRCVCSPIHAQKGNSSCEEFKIHLGDSCEDSMKCQMINARCRRDYEKNNSTKTCQCFKGQLVSDDGQCKDSPGKIDWARVSRGYPLYQDLYPGKLTQYPTEDETEDNFFKIEDCNYTLKLEGDSERTLPILFHKQGFDIKFKMNQKIDGTLKLTFTSLREKKMGSLSLSSRGPDVLKFGKAFKHIHSGVSDETPVSNIFFRIENEEGKSMLGFDDGTSAFNVSMKKISNVMDLPTNLGISSDYPGSVSILCE